MKASTPTLLLLASVAAAGVQASGDRATSRLSITKTANPMPALPLVLKGSGVLDWSGLHAWGRGAGAKLVSHRLAPTSDDLATELILVTFE